MKLETIVSGEGRIVETLCARPSLVGQDVSLEPMQIEHVDGLVSAASDGQLWNLQYTGVPAPDQMQSVVEQAIVQRELGLEFPFIVRMNKSGLIVGSTRYYGVAPQNRKVSIGYTWYSQSVQRTSVNTECKYLLLELAFDHMSCVSVQWHTDHRNKSSQAAIKRLGAKFEGVLRNDRIMPDGVIRHTHCFSMLDSEWPDSKQHLMSRLNHYRS